MMGLWTTPTIRHEVRVTREQATAKNYGDIEAHFMRALCHWLVDQLPARTYANVLLSLVEMRDVYTTNERMPPPGGIKTARGLTSDVAAAAPEMAGQQDPSNLFVVALMAAHDIDSIDAATSDIQKRLRAYRDEAVADELDGIARGRIGVSYDQEKRILAMEALAGAKVASFEPMVLELIRHMCSTDDEHLQVAAVAVATHLSRLGKRELRSLMIRLSTEASERVRRAAAAFLRASAHI
ncbi:hypothetical protein AB3662_43595 [Sorangium cellulosum]|uniref:hypothetical protein n=1 Tax=Sorangium cellulosum TaxID=56 RepID=UPI003D9A95D9